jgi:gamma-aminobutyric acid receptor subunit alpha
VLTLSTIALESRTDLPKVHYATAMDWFIICSFGYCIATLLEFAGVHYFTKVIFKSTDNIKQNIIKLVEAFKLLYNE